MRISTTIRWLLPPLVCAAVPLVGVPAMERFVVSPNGTRGFLFPGILFVIPWLLSVPALVVALIGLAFRKHRKGAAAVALSALAYFASFPASERIGYKVRMQAFHKLADRSKPLVDAIRSFDRKYGKPPESLQALVPEFITLVPSTGMGAYPEYRYTANPTNFLGNPWALVVFTPSGGINFDQFMYFPLTNYPTNGFGGWIERVGDWAYVHE